MEDILWEQNNVPLTCKLIGPCRLFVAEYEPNIGKNWITKITQEISKLVTYISDKLSHGKTNREKKI